MSTVNVLLAEDDKNLGYLIKEYLLMNGYEVQLACDGEEGLELFNRSTFDICILDVMMPKVDGFVLASEIRKLDESVPIVFLTAKALKVDKLKGFNIGADDYLIKPIDEEELAARIQAILKRSNRSDIATGRTYDIGKYLFDYSNQRLIIEGNEIALTQKETEILKALCDHQGKILDRNNALKEMWGKNDYFNRRSMDVFISRLRKYLSKDRAISIKNIHGRGFILKVEK
ncbi:response regulator transcription factor [Ekhidna sp.]|uniref:response regulator transcription factor n=1 Tax=Ekhidna sp. TaxID=2608089 RepID=UPI0032EFACB8